LLTIETVAYFV